MSNSAEYWVVYNLETGEEVTYGMGLEPGVASMQRPPEGFGVLEVPEAFVYSSPRDLSILKTAQRDAIDAQAEKIRNLFITPGSGQAITYIWKAQEADAVLTNPEAPAPLLMAEAAALGVTVVELAQQVQAQAVLWLTVGAKIEAARLSAKKAVDLAETVGAIHTATQIDWEAALA